MIDIWGYLLIDDVVCSMIGRMVIIGTSICRASFSASMLCWQCQGHARDWHGLVSKGAFAPYLWIYWKFILILIISIAVLFKTNKHTALHLLAFTKGITFGGLRETQHSFLSVSYQTFQFLPFELNLGRILHRIVFKWRNTITGTVLMLVSNLVQILRQIYVLLLVHFQSRLVVLQSLFGGLVHHYIYIDIYILDFVQSRSFILWAEGVFA